MSHEWSSYKLVKEPSSFNWPKGKRDEWIDVLKNSTNLGSKKSVTTDDTEKEASKITPVFDYKDGANQPSNVSDNGNNIHQKKDVQI